MSHATFPTAASRFLPTLTLLLLILVSSASGQGTLDPNDAPRIRVVNASWTAASVELEYGSIDDTIGGVVSMTASRSQAVEPGPVTWRVRINEKEWREPVTTVLKPGTIYSIFVARALSDSGEVVTIFERSGSRELDSLNGDPTPRADQAQVGITVLPYNATSFRGEIVSNANTTGSVFQIRQEGWPQQNAPIANVDTGAMFVDIHGESGFPLLDRSGFFGVRAGERHRILVETFPDSTFNVWRYDELDTTEQMFVASKDVEVSLVEGRVRLVNVMHGGYYTGRIEPGSDTMLVEYTNVSPWIDASGGRLILTNTWYGDELYNDTVELARKGLTSLLLYDSLRGLQKTGVLPLHTYPRLDGDSAASLRFAIAVGEPLSLTFDVARGGVPVARFDTLADLTVTPYTKLESANAPYEFGIFAVDGSRLSLISTLSLRRNSYTTIIVTTGPALAGNRQAGDVQNERGFGFYYVYVLREFPDYSTASALSLLAGPSRVGEPPAIERAEIWPNPSRGTLSLRLEPGRAVIGNLVASDMLGRVVADFGEQNLGAGGTTLEIDISNLAAGVYTLAILEKGGGLLPVGEVVRR